MTIVSIALFCLGLCVLALAAFKMLRAFSRAPAYFPEGYREPASAEARYAFNYLILGPAVPRVLQRDYIVGYYLACAAFSMVALGFVVMNQPIYAGILGVIVVIYALSAVGLVRGYRELGPEGGQGGATPPVA